MRCDVAWETRQNQETETRETETKIRDRKKEKPKQATNSFSKRMKKEENYKDWEKGIFMFFMRQYKIGGHILDFRRL